LGLREKKWGTETSGVKTFSIFRVPSTHKRGGRKRRGGEKKKKEPAKMGKRKRVGGGEIEGKKGWSSISLGSFPKRGKGEKQKKRWGNPNRVRWGKRCLDVEGRVGVYCWTPGGGGRDAGK